MKSLQILARIFSAVLVVWLTMAPTAGAVELENTLYLELKDGRVVIEMRPDLAPAHVARIKDLVRAGFYDGLKFHRVIPGFMAQGGDPKGTGSGGSGVNIPAEFSKEPFSRGTVGMARSSNPNSGDSQFFIMFARARSLDNNYTVWGKVLEGMTHVDKIKRGTGQGGSVEDPDKILSMKIAADGK
jgi:peptidylprolyl isomerase